MSETNRAHLANTLGDLPCSPVVRGKLEDEGGDNSSHSLFLFKHPILISSTGTCLLS